MTVAKLIALLEAYDKDKEVWMGADGWGFEIFSVNEEGNGKIYINDHCDCEEEE